MFSRRSDRRGRRTRRQRLFLTLGSMLVAVCVLGAAGVGYAYVRYNSITRYDVALPPAAAGEPSNFLIVGSDSRDGVEESDSDYHAFVDGVVDVSGMRTDTIMVLRIDPDEEQADLLSVPRDLWVPIGDLDGGKDRINSAFSQSRQTLIDTIQANLGIPIHHYVEVDFTGFKGLVSSLGGVNVYVDAPLRDANTGLDIASPGCVKLDSIQALQFVRARHLQIQQDGRWVSDPTGDLGRMRRQQLFIREAVGEALGKGLGNPVTLNHLVGVGVDAVGLDPGLGVQELLSFGRRFANYDESSLRTHALTVEPFRTGGGAAVLDIDEEASEEVLNIFRGLAPGTVSKKFIDLTVLNGSDTPGQATDAASALGKIGFRIDVIGDSSEVMPRTALYYAPGSEGAALQAVAHLTSRAELVIDETLDANEIVLVTGPDFTTVHETPTSSDLTALLPVTTSTTASYTATDDTDTTDDSSPTTTEPPGYVPETEAAVVCK